MAVGDLIFLPLYLYLCIVCARHAVTGAGKFRALYLLTSVLLVPSAAFIHFVGNWKVFSAGPFNSLSAWLVVPVSQGDGLPPAPVNLVVGIFALTLVYLFASLLVEVTAQVYDSEGRHVHALHKALAKWALVIVGFLFYLGTQRVSLTPLLVGMGAVSLVVGLALQETLSNLFAGLAIEAEGVTGRGEWIELDGQMVGRVIDKGWRSTRIETIKNELVVIPNRILSAGRVINYNHPDPRHALILKIGASYKDPPLKVKELLRHILLQERQVVDDPPPKVFVSEYGDYYVNYSLMFWIQDHGRRFEIQDSIYTKIWYSFHNHGVEIPFPVRTVQMLNKAEQEEIQEEIDSKTDELAAYLQGFGALSGHLTIGECRYLARNSTENHSSPGDRIIKKGDPGDSIFFVYKGECEVELPSGGRKTLVAGDYFGEMALLSTAPRAADVWASSAGATTIRVGRECMDTVFEQHPRLRSEFERLRERRVQESGLVDEAEDGNQDGSGLRFLKAALEFLKPW